MQILYFGDPCKFEVQESYRDFLVAKVEEYSQRLGGTFRLGMGNVIAKRPVRLEMLRNTAKLAVGSLALEGNVVTRQRVVEKLRNLPPDTPRELRDTDYQPFTSTGAIFDQEAHTFWARYPEASKLNETLIAVTDAYNVIKSYAQTGRQPQHPHEY